MTIKKNLELKEVQKLVCFGAGEQGEIFAQLCKEKNIRISYFCDNDKNKWGTEFHGVSVCSLVEVLEKKDDFVFIITNERFKYEILCQLEENGVSQVYFSSLESEWLMTNSVSKNKELELLSNINYQKIKKEHPEGVFLASANVVIIRDCTLNCNHCFAEVPYLKESDRLDMNIFRKLIDCYSSLFDSIHAIKITGGESMLHPDLYHMIRYTASKKNIHQVDVFSNATLLLKEEELTTLDNSKVSFFFSNYGDLNVKLEDNIKLLKKYNLAYVIIKHDFWISSKTELNLQEDTNNLKDRFQTCKFIHDGCASIVNKHYQLCGMPNKAYHENKLPQDALDWVEVDLEKRSVEEIKKDLKAYHEKDYLETCRYCPGKDVAKEKKVPVAEQLKGKLSNENRLKEIPLNEQYKV